MLALEPPGIQRVESRAIALTTASPGKIAQGRRAARRDLSAIVRPLSRRPGRACRRWLFGSAICASPAPHFGAFAARHHALPVDVGDHVAVAAEQRLGRAHLGAGGELALREAVRAVLRELLFREVLLRAAGAERALVHLAAHAEGAGLRILRRAERAGVEAIAAADAEVLVVQDDAFRGLVEAVDRAHRHARRIRAVHAGHRDRALARLAVVQRDDAAAVHAPGHFVRVLARGDAAVALDAALGVAEKFHSRHVGPRSLSYARSTWQSVVLVSCIMVTRS